MINAETRGRYREKAAPAREYDCLGFAMMWTGVKSQEVGADNRLGVRRHRANPTRTDFKLSATSAECGAVIKHENIRTWRGSRMPVTVRGGIFIRGGSRRGGLPPAKLDTEGGIQVRDRGVCGIVSPEFHKGVASF